MCGKPFVPKRREAAEICPRSACRVKAHRQAKHDIKHWADYYDNPHNPPKPA
jgi:hypothetical protein